MSVTGSGSTIIQIDLEGRRYRFSISSLHGMETQLIDQIITIEDDAEDSDLGQGDQAPPMGFLWICDPITKEYGTEHYPLYKGANLIGRQEDPSDPATDPGPANMNNSSPTEDLRIAELRETLGDVRVSGEDEKETAGYTH